jgi:hypothetical protein
MQEGGIIGIGQGHVLPGELKPRFIRSRRSNDISSAKVRATSQ